MLVVIVLWGLAALVIVEAVIGGRRLFWAVRAWAYAHPAAHEPSDAAVAAHRAVAVVLAVVLIGLGVAAGNRNGAFETTASKVGQAVDEAVANLDSNMVMEDELGTEVAGLYRDQVRAAVAEADESLDLTVRHVGDEEYTVETSGGDEAHCIRVTGDEQAIIVPFGADADQVASAPFHSLAATADSGACR
ncbi:hypothetical protein [Streptomyces marincola]|uniref:hypothetical protein n=1 Tax=Streptomyces marincola TaxID=2878388 RepID=UPI001CF17CA0|nr:hypothetical protein [Streptomyces marincola]UCM89718.1 hypothetical protein LC193_18140 [Streptomyces marincola]